MCLTKGPSRCYLHDAACGGLGCPAPPAGEAPPSRNTDFVYFALTIAATTQAADVAVTARAMRQLVLMQSALAYALNTAVLAPALDIVAGAPLDEPAHRPRKRHMRSRACDAGAQKLYVYKSF